MPPHHLRMGAAPHGARRGQRGVPRRGRCGGLHRRTRPRRWRAPVGERCSARGRLESRSRPCCGGGGSALGAARVAGRHRLRADAGGRRGHGDHLPLTLLPTPRRSRPPASQRPHRRRPRLPQVRRVPRRQPHLLAHARHAVRRRSTAQAALRRRDLRARCPHARRCRAVCGRAGRGAHARARNRRATQPAP